MADKKRAGSKLLSALGKTKKEQMAKLYPKVKPKAYPRVKGDVRGKGPYLRGKVSGTGDFLKRKAAVAGTKFPKPTKKKGIGIADVIGAGAAGFAVGRYGPKKTKAKDTTSHKDKAREAAEKGIKKQKEKRDEGRRHDEKMTRRRNKMKKHHSD